MSIFGRIAEKVGAFTGKKGGDTGELGTAYAEDAKARIARFSLARVDPIVLSFRDVISGRFKTVYDDPKYDPIDVAKVELEIFVENCDEARSKLVQEYHEHLADIFTFLRANSQTEIEGLLDKLINDEIDGRFAILFKDALELYNFTVAEIQSKKTEM